MIFAFNMIEMNEILKEYMEEEEEEEGEWELTDSSRLGRQQQDRVVTSVGSSRLGRG
jgi:hypothetical protein